MFNTFITAVIIVGLKSSLQRITLK